MSATYSMDDIIILSGCRTPIGAFNKSLSSLSAVNLGSIVCQEAIKQAELSPSSISEVILGQVLTAGAGQNPARQSALNAGVSQTTPCYTVNMVCGSGLKSVCLGAQSLKLGHSNIVLVGGQENMSQAGHVTPSMLRSGGVKMGPLTLTDTMLNDGLTDAFSNIHMGNTAENIARKYKLTRKEQDEFAANSQQKYHKAQEKNLFQNEIVPVEVPADRGSKVVFSVDEHPRASTTEASLSKLRPAFMKDESATVTAGNSSGLNDGAAALVMTTPRYLASRGDGARSNDRILGRLVSCAETGCDPNLMGLGPIEAVKLALTRANWTIDQVDLFELNEAFAAQSIAVCRELKVPMEKVNVHGGAIALGHPIGASGARILVTLLHAMKSLNKSRGVAALCIGGGMGIAVCVERL